MGEDDGAPSRAARACDVACAIAAATLAAATAVVELVAAVESEGTTKVRTRPATALVPTDLGGGSCGITGAGAGAGSAAVPSNAAWMRSFGVGLLGAGAAAAGVGATGATGRTVASWSGSWGSGTAFSCGTGLALTASTAAFICSAFTPLDFLRGRPKGPFAGGSSAC